VTRLVDLSHVVRDGTETYPGLPGPVIGPHLTFEASRRSYDEGTEFQIARITMVANTGTYLDTPSHRYAGGHDLSGLPLEACADLPVVVVDAGRPEHPGAGAEVAAGRDLRGAAVLMRTGWDRHWGTARYGASDHPHLTAAGARALVDAGAALVGIDSVNIDDTSSGARPAHSILLAADVPVVEHLAGLDSVPASGARFFAVPPRVEGMGSFPVRAFVLVP
jgi:arylformamidase